MPRGKTTATRRKKTARKKTAAKKPAPVGNACMVVGCDRPALAKHQDRAGDPVWLCGNHDRIAKQNLAAAEKRQHVLNVLGTPIERGMALRKRQRERLAAR